MDLIGTENGFCAQTAGFWQLVGNILLVFKILIPVALIILGIIILGKAVISSDEKEMKKGFNSMLKKFLIAVLIFFIPSIVTTLFGIVNGFNELKADYNVCQKCVAHPKSDYCENKVIAVSKGAN
ncbi:MAG: hypothetical protein E7164_04070 [Firmicutes bacterium]|nr:hypothetical protein [Bacillota bacterium]